MFKLSEVDCFIENIFGLLPTTLSRHGACSDLSYRKISFVSPFRCRDYVLLHMKSPRKCVLYPWCDGRRSQFTFPGIKLRFTSQLHNLSETSTPGILAVIFPSSLFQQSVGTIAENGCWSRKRSLRTLNHMIAVHSVVGKTVRYAS